jgi:hypothetical protein
MNYDDYIILKGENAIGLQYKDKCVIMYDDGRVYVYTLLPDIDPLKVVPK